VARYIASIRTDAGSATLPIISLYAAATVSPSVVEFGCHNTAGVALQVFVTLLTSQGTPGAAITVAKFDPDSAAAVCTPFTTHTVAPALGTDCGFRYAQGASIGGGAIFAPPGGIDVPVGTGNGIGLIPVGTGQICDCYIVWDEPEL
jgi:hypothetical protein